MAAALTDQQLRDVEARLSRDPRILQAIQADRQKRGGRMQYARPNDPGFRDGPAAVLREYGIEFPDAVDYQIMVDPSGQVKLKRLNWYQRNADWIVPVSTFVTAGATSAFSGGGGAAAGGGGNSLGGNAAASASGSSGPFTAAGTTAAAGPGYGSAVDVAQSVGNVGGNVATNGRWWTDRNVIAAGIGGGFGLLGAYMQKRAMDKAAGLEVDMSREALALEKEFFERAEAYQRQLDAEDRRRYDQEYERDERRYAQDREDAAPYRNIGGSALGRLAFGSGLPDPGVARELPARYADGTNSPTPLSYDSSLPPPVFGTPAGQGTGKGEGSLAALGNVSGGSMRSVRTPTGQTVLVPAAQLDEALANGGTLVDQPSMSSAITNTLNRQYNSLGARR